MQIGQEEISGADEMGHSPFGAPTAVSSRQRQSGSSKGRRTGCGSSRRSWAPFANAWAPSCSS